MPRTCSVCTHLAREEIDKQLLSGAPYRSIARQFEASESAFFRHKSEGHIPQAMAQAEDAKEIANADSLLDELQKARQRTYDLLDKAEEAANTKIYGAPVQYLREIREQIKLLAELEGKLAAQPQVNILINPQWIELRTRIVHALDGYP